MRKIDAHEGTRATASLCPRPLVEIAECRARTTGRRALVVSAPEADKIVFVESALAPTDKTIVTGNLAHYPLEILHGLRVLTPAQAEVELAQNLPP